jgi:tetratricopeptide (TPR) repeat protein
MKQLSFLLFAIFLLFVIHAQEPNLCGVVVVKNSKEKTGIIEYVKDTQIQCFNPNKVTTSDNFGKFVMFIPDKYATIFASPTGRYEHYKIVNENFLKNIKLPETSVVISICKVADWDYERAYSVGVCLDNYMSMHEYNKIKKRLQSEFNTVELSSIRWKEIADSLSFIANDIDQARKLIEDYVDKLMLVNLDFINELDALELNKKKAYKCAMRGELDSVFIYLKDTDEQLDEAMVRRKKAQEDAKLFQEAADINKEIVQIENDRISSLIESIILKAQTAASQNKYEDAVFYYEKAINADTLNVGNILEFADYLCKIREYDTAEKYYQKCLEKYRALDKENPKIYLSKVALTLNNFAFLHSETNKPWVALKEYEEALEIRRKLAEDDMGTYLPDVAQTLNNIAGLHREINEYTTALKEHEEALEIGRILAEKNPKTYLPLVASTLNKLAILHTNPSEYKKALEEYEEALKISREFAEENSTVNFSNIAIILNNLAILHKNTKEYTTALKEHEEALKIRRKLAEENPKTYLPEVAISLHNFGILYWTMDSSLKALEKYEEALEIRKKLAEKNPIVYLPDMALTLHSLAVLHATNKEEQQAIDLYEEVLIIFRKLAKDNPKYLQNLAITLNTLANSHTNIKEYPQALKEYEEALKIHRELAEKNPNKHLPEMAKILSNSSWTYLLNKEYIQSEQSARQALELDNSVSLSKCNLAHVLLFQNRFLEAEVIYIELSQTIKKDNETYAKTLLKELEELEAADAIPEECKANVEKIRKMLKEKE